MGDGFCFGTEEDEKMGWLYLSYETLMERGASGWAGKGGGGLSGKFGDEKAEGFSGGKVAGWSGIIAACGFFS